MAQAVVRGPGCLKFIAEYPALMYRVFVVHGKNSYAASGAEAALVKAGLRDMTCYSEVKENPELETILDCAEAYRTSGAAAVIAVGGGSVIDTAKAALAALSAADSSSLLANTFNLPADKPFFAAVPTTAGSGSEATHFAVLYHKGLKYSLAKQGLKPDLVFLDPNLTLSCRAGQSLVSAADAVCQAIESFWNKSATCASRNLALQALHGLLDNFSGVLDRPDDLAARSGMLYAANLAGQAIDITKTTAGHALSYGLTSLHGFPHGIAVLTVMEPLVQLMDTRKFFSPPEYESLHRVFHAFGRNFPEAFHQFYNQVMVRAHELDLRLKFTETPDPETLVDNLASMVNAERLANHPVELSAADIRQIYKKIVQH
jgi:alcohol dehydrogenase